MKRGMSANEGEHLDKFGACRLAAGFDPNERYYVGLDVASKKTQICILTSRGDVYREKHLPTVPRAIADYLHKYCASNIQEIGMETGGMSAFLHKSLRAYGLPVHCLDALHINRFLSLRRNKTDRNDARGIADLVRTSLDLLNAVHVKSMACHEIRSTLIIRNQQVRQRVQTEAVIRGILRTYGVVIADKGGSDVFRDECMDRLAQIVEREHIDLRSRIIPMLDLCQTLKRNYDLLES